MTKSILGQNSHNWSMNFSEGGAHVLKKWLALGEPQKRGSDLACEEFTKLGRLQK